MQNYACNTIRKNLKEDIKKNTTGKLEKAVVNNTSIKTARGQILCGQHIR